jgi:hypothetical protein
VTTTVPAGAAPISGASAAAQSRTADFGTVQARRSESVVDAYGIGIHTSYWDTTYGDTERLAEALKDLGVEHVRDDLWNNEPRAYTDINYVAREAGVKYNLILGNPGRGQAASQYIDTIDQHLLGAVEMIEGTNEWDNFGPGNWVEQVRRFQTELYAAAKANPRTAGLPLLSPSMAWWANLEKLGTQVGASDIGNLHLYPGGLKPSFDIVDATRAIRSRTGTTRTIVTEAGYHNATNTSSGHHPVTEDVAATYLPRMLAEHALAGTERIYSYELVDQWAEPGKTDIEAHFGLMRHDWSPKPAYHAMKNLLAVLDDSEATFTPEPLTYAVSGGGSDVRQLLTQRSDGTHVLLMWRDVSVWSTGSRSRLDVPSTPVTLSLPAEARIAVNEPNVAATPTTVGVGTDVTIPLRGQLVAVEISDAAPGLPELPDVTDIDVDEVPAAVERVKVAPLKRAARVSWTVERIPAQSARTMPRTWRVKVFRGNRAVRTLTRPGGTQSVTVEKLSPRFRYRFAVVAGSAAGPATKPTMSKYVKPRGAPRNGASPQGQRAPGFLQR